jgi:hypothetical protein
VTQGSEAEPPTEDEGRESKDKYDSNQAKEKYLKATDFLEIQIANALAGETTVLESIKLIIGLFDLMDLEKAVVLCFDSNLEEMLFTAMKMLQNNSSVEELKARLIITMFK